MPKVTEMKVDEPTPDRDNPDPRIMLLITASWLGLLTIAISPNELQVLDTIDGSQGGQYLKKDRGPWDPLPGLKLN